MPHGGSWLNLDKMGVHRWVVITRERDYAAKSAVRNGHVSTLTEARSRYDLAMSLLEAQLHEDGNRVVWVTYEQLVADPAAVVNSIATAWGVDPWPIDDLDVYDGNERYRPKPKPEPDAE